MYRIYYEVKNRKINPYCNNIVFVLQNISNGAKRKTIERQINFNPREKSGVILLLVVST